MPASSIPTKGADGRRLKTWEVEAQASVDINKNLNDFLEHIKDEPLGPSLAAIATELSKIYEDNERETRRFTHDLQKRFQEEGEGYDKDALQFIRKLTSGLQSGLHSLDKGNPIPKEWFQQMDKWLNEQSKVISHKFNHRKQIFTITLTKKYTEAEKNRQATLINEELMLLKLFWKVKRSIDAKERTIEEGASTLELQSSAKIIPTKANNTGFAAAPRTILPSSPTGAVSTPNKQMPASPNKKQKTTAYYDLTESPEPTDISW
ncbi:f01b71f1-4c1b-4329-8502-18332c7e3576 [Sclerotinia trifoliorum]|uniref:F01b71f1-4c1b-4329-8502-18332c7e3576 n=1 Tax=Sclerotinia trifoliorum TaxID=28548 RepID=A0A8H2VN76_9HELO|nr:f01b71f1-4c1b-4329-8502-18332c7e3576 [Sclerotinia trifoliorum]